MRSIFFAVLAVLSLTPAVRPAVIQRPPRIAKAIVCAPSKAYGIDGTLRFYTRLDSLVSLAGLPKDGQPAAEVWNGEAPKADESAAQLNDGRSATATQGIFTYAAYSCDSWDYTFTFPTADLVEKKPGSFGQKIKGRVGVTLRGSPRHPQNEKAELDCVALF